MILVDAHVHIYDRFDLDQFFTCAFRNFSKGAAELGLEQYTPVIFLADWSNVNWFNRLKDRAGVGADTTSSYSIQETEDKHALRVELQNHKALYLLAGRKIITAENLEVLALCSSNDFSDGLPLPETICAIGEADAIPVIPWAVGKWLGVRGKALDALMEGTQKAEFYLCDNGNRPGFWGWPRHFRIAETLNIPILSGSDPLHFSSEVTRTGCFGFGIDTTLNDKTPCRDLYAYLKNFDITPVRYGKLERTLRFVKNQFLMQVFKKKWRKELLK
jgi:hypothetical protein